jgi:hypothetical protein
LQIVPLEFYVQVSPDGSKLAFTTSGDKGGIWIRDLESVEARLLPGTGGGVNPFWSPDNKSLAFGVGNKLIRVEISGGPPQVLCESSFPVSSGFWTEDGEIVFGGRVGPLQRVKAAGGDAKPVAALVQGEVFQAWPSLFPDRRHFLYLILGPGAKGGLYVESLDAKPDQQPRLQVAPAQFGAAFRPFQKPGRRRSVFRP